MVYCHFDGYIEGNGVELLRDYNSEEKARELVVSDMSGLGEFYDDELNYRRYELKDYIHKVRHDIFIEFVYLYNTITGKWMVWDKILGKMPQPLEQAVAEIKEDNLD